MPELVLTRTPGDRRLFSLDGVGSVRILGWLQRSAAAEAGGRRWRFARRSFWSQATEATDEAGGHVGEFEPRTWRRGGVVRWHGRELQLRPASAWRQRYALADGEVELAVVDAKGRSKRPVAVAVDDLAALDPGLLLFTVFVVRGVAAESAAAAVV